MHEIAREILAYLAENPDAADTAEGIAGWWLPAGKASPPRASLESALAELTAAGWLSENRGMDARSRYRLARDKVAAIAAFRRESGR